ncbi:MAG: T9SS type A sorting domain-containing protein [Bacteroidetes bacterium]|nr:T9SS type A sorting domain-containing protein [Bacteroidota bacterium]
MKSKAFIFFIHFSAILSLTGFIFAQPGSLDLSFGVNGKVITSLSSLNNIAQDVALQSDGKIIVTGFLLSDSSYKFVTVRYNPNGSLDASFGNGGVVITQIGNTDDKATSIKIDTSGYIYIGGYTWTGSKYDFALLKYKTDGTLDTRFNNSGIVTTSVGIFDDMANSLALQNDGKIIQSGISERVLNLEFAIVRYNTDGTLDNSFGTGGVITTAISTFDNRAQSVASLNDKRILLAGYSNSLTDNNFTVVRYKQDGTLDNTFGDEGKVATEIGKADDFAKSVLIENGGKILVSGYSFDGSKNVFSVVRYKIDGTVDSTYGVDGIKMLSLNNIDDKGSASVLQSDGKLIIGGVSSNGSNFDFALTRLDSTGNIDASFGNVITDILSFDDTLTSVILQDDGKILAVGGAYNGSNYDFVLVRYNNDLVTSLNDDKKNNTIPKKFSLAQNYPNPFNPSTTISYQLSADSFVDLKIYNLLGMEVTTLVNETKSAGNYTVHFDASSVNRGLTSGVYFYRLTATGEAVNFVQTKKMILIK